MTAFWMPEIMPLELSSSLLQPPRNLFLMLLPSLRALAT
jgi:hypothetical protein